MEARISSLEALKERLASLLDRRHLELQDDQGHGTTCWVEGTPESVYARLLLKTEPELWSVYGGVVWAYKPKEANFLLTLQAANAQGLTLLMASVVSLHVEHLASTHQVPVVPPHSMEDLSCTAGAH